MTPRTDEHGRLQGVRCHDGHLLAVETFEDVVVLTIRRTDRTRVRVVLEGVRKFSVNQFLEGNIVDTMYLWDRASAPANQRAGAAAAFNVDELYFDQANLPGTTHLFVLESSYGATVYALVDQVRIESE